MKRKVGNLLVDGRKFPIWLENFADDRLMWVIQVVCEQVDFDVVHNEFLGRDYNHRWVGEGNNIGVYSLRERERAMSELKELAKDGLADIDFGKVDNLFLQVDKSFVLRRLKG